ncbi:hypothetical protein [Paenibacillus sp. TH7-28]
MNIIPHAQSIGDSGKYCLFREIQHIVNTYVTVQELECSIREKYPVGIQNAIHEHTENVEQAMKELTELRDVGY